MDDILYAVIDSPVYTYKVLVASHIEHGQIGEIQFYIRESSIHISWSEVVRHLRGKGYGEILYRCFADYYNREQFKVPISRLFINEKAERIAHSLVDDGTLPPHSWDKSRIARDY
jgi:predicted GNAT family acetyltransferase